MASHATDKKTNSLFPLPDCYSHVHSKHNTILPTSLCSFSPSKSILAIRRSPYYSPADWWPFLSVCENTVKGFSGLKMKAIIERHWKPLYRMYWIAYKGLKYFGFFMNMFLSYPCMIGGGKTTCDWKFLVGTCKERNLRGQWEWG